MKKQKVNYYYAVFFTLILSVLTACSTDGTKKEESTEGYGKVNLYFDHGINGNQLVIKGGADFTYPSVKGETLRNIEALDYVISNIELTDESGETFKFPTDSLFIVSMENKENKVVLDHIPSGKYVSITFGIGVPYKKWAEGLKAQEKFFKKAMDPRYNIGWTWASGYKNVRFEGQVHSEKMADKSKFTRFEVHIGDHIGTSKSTTQNNYREVTLPFKDPETATLSDYITIHIKVDAGKILNGKNKIKLFDNNCSIMFNPKIDPKIADNLTDGMFIVDHVESYDAH